MNTDRDLTDKSRRSFLQLLPLGVFAGVFAWIGSAGFRFLRPRLSAPSEQWLDVANVSELTGPQPIAKKVLAEHVSGWVITNQEHNVFVLPAKNNQVLSPICPHEGCEVAWEQASNRFACPCHTSFFNADGSRISGPTPRGLDALPTRVQDGKLQVQYRVSSQQETHA
jgi:quinol---cytochrome c reductase iron-sulfur subunit, bacillus type